MSYEQLHKLESAIEYEFKNFDLLVQAMTHSSYANEHRIDKLYKIFHKLRENIAPCHHF